MVRGGLGTTGGDVDCMRRLMPLWCLPWYEVLRHESVAEQLEVHEEWITFWADRIVPRRWPALDVLALPPLQQAQCLQATILWCIRRALREHCRSRWVAERNGAQPLRLSPDEHFHAWRGASRWKIFVLRRRVRRRK